MESKVGFSTLKEIKQPALKEFILVQESEGLMCHFLQFQYLAKINA